MNSLTNLNVSTPVTTTTIKMQNISITPKTPSSTYAVSPLRHLGSRQPLTVFCQDVHLYIFSNIKKGLLYSQKVSHTQLDSVMSMIHPTLSFHHF